MMVDAEVWTVRFVEARFLVDSGNRFGILGSDG